MEEIEKTKIWYEQEYTEEGFAAQRLYPNEELLRFMGRNFFGVPFHRRNNTKILEVGCGSCSNLWMIAREEFQAYGIDLSQSAIALGTRMFGRWQASAQLTVGSMTETPYENGFFDAICDVFSSNCLDMANFEKFLIEAYRVLKPGGRIFMYTPSTASDAFKNFKPSKKIDHFTLNGIYRKSSPFYGNFYPFRFSDPKWLRDLLIATGFHVSYLELVSRSYGNLSELFEFVVVEAIKSRQAH